MLEEGQSLRKVSYSYQTAAVKCTLVLELTVKSVEHEIYVGQRQQGMVCG